MSLFFLRDSIMGIPKDIFVTNTPSITSRCTISAPAAAISATSEARFDKSDASTDGEILVILIYLPIYIIIKCKKQYAKVS